MNSPQSVNEPQGNESRASSETDANMGLGGSAPHNSGSLDEFHRDSAQMDLLFTAISSVVITVTVFVLAFGIVIESDREINTLIIWISIAILSAITLGILIPAICAVNKTNKFDLSCPDSRQKYTLCFNKLNIIFRAVSSIGSVIALILLGISVIDGNSWMNNKFIILFIIIALFVASIGIIIATVQTVKKPKKTLY